MGAVHVLDFVVLGAGTGYVAGRFAGLAIEGTTRRAEPLVTKFAVGGAAGGAVQGGIAGIISSMKTKDCQER